MSTDKDPYRMLTTVAVLLVAGIAAVISFVHIESMAVRYGQPVLGAWLLPVSIDGTVAVSSLAMLRAARLNLSSPWLARGMLLLAVAATLACNVAYGLPHGLADALLSGWPAVAFVGSAEVAISMSRKRPPRGHDRIPSPDKKPDGKRPKGPCLGEGRGWAARAAPAVGEPSHAAAAADPEAGGNYASLGRRARCGQPGLASAAAPGHRGTPAGQPRASQRSPVCRPAPQH